MVTVFEHKSPHAFVQISDSESVEFVDYTFLTENEKTVKKLKDSNGFENWFWVAQEVKDRAELEELKKQEAKPKRRIKVVSGATGTSN
jgi:hypothetical protein